MNVLSFSIFGSRQYTKENKWLFWTYLRGLVWNVKMARLIYPDFLVHVEIESAVFSDYDNIFYGLKDHYGISFTINETVPLCKAMLWRMKSCFWDTSDYVFTRDADAILTMRERKCVQEFLNSGMSVHAMTDNPAHGVGLMGGMGGYNAKLIREKYGSWDNLLSKSPVHIDSHGTDQVLLNAVVFMDFKGRVVAHYLNGEKGTWVDAKVYNNVPDIQIPSVNPPLWESDLTCRHIGSPGVVEMEVRRFFQRHDKEIPEFEEICKRYPAVFPWYINE